MNPNSSISLYFFCELGFACCWPYRSFSPAPSSTFSSSVKKMSNMKTISEKWIDLLQTQLSKQAEPFFFLKVAKISSFLIKTQTLIFLPLFDALWRNPNLFVSKRGRDGAFGLVWFLLFVSPCAPPQNGI